MLWAVTKSILGIQNTVYKIIKGFILFDFCFVCVCV